MINERITFTGAHGDELSARLSLPADGRVRACALFAHCFTCSKDLKPVVNISRALTQRGIAVLRFDFTGLGESEGDFADTDFSSNVDDLAAAADFLAAEYEAPSILVGHSLGGAAVLRAAERVPSATAVATIGAPAEPSHVERLLVGSIDEIRAAGEAEVELAGRRFTIRREFLDDLEATSMRDAIRGLGRALLVFHSPVDEYVDVDNARGIFEAAKHPKSFVSLDDADHLLTRERDARYVGRVLAAWAHRYLELPDIEETEREPTDNRVVARIGDAGFRTALLASGHALTADEPLAVGGTNAGPTPYDLLAAALGACTAMTLRMYADRKGWPLEEAVIRLEHEKVHQRDDEEACEGREARMDRLERAVELTGPLDDDQRARLVEIANRCPVHRTLDAGVLIETRLERGTAPVD
ncbi:MAG: alpha/beta fold hydrolase [Gemmatimonadota bacterium]